MDATRRLCVWLCVYVCGSVAVCVYVCGCVVERLLQRGHCGSVAGRGPFERDHIGAVPCYSLTLCLLLSSTAGVRFVVLVACSRRQTRLTPVSCATCARHLRPPALRQRHCRRRSMPPTRRRQRPSRSLPQHRLPRLRHKRRRRLLARSVFTVRIGVLTGCVRTTASMVTK